MLQVRPELVSIGHSARKAALSVPLLGWFARTPAEDETMQRGAAQRQRRGARSPNGRTTPPRQPPAAGTPLAYFRVFSRQLDNALKNSCSPTTSASALLCYLPLLWALYCAASQLNVIQSSMRLCVAGGEQHWDSGSSGGGAWDHLEPVGGEEDDEGLPPPVRRSWAQRFWGGDGAGR